MPKSQVKAILYQGFTHIPITTCAAPDAVDDRPFGAPLDIVSFPNPFSGTATVRFTCGSGRLRLSVFDAYGQELAVLADGDFSAGTHEVSYDGPGLAAGNYFLHLKTEAGSRTERLMKMK